MNILLLGKNGQVGRELQRTLLPLGKLIAVGRNDLNLEELSLLNSCLQAYKPAIIVNAAAYTSVDKAESEPNIAHLINAHAMVELADYAQKNQALLVHYSTDYVFDGKKQQAYIESDPTNPQNVYGESKRAGELAILQSGCPYLIFRTSWVYSVYGNNFIKTILRLAKERKTLRIVSDQYGTPTSAELIADVTSLAIYAYQSRLLDQGIFHLSAGDSTNWHGLGCYAIKKAKKNSMKLALDIHDIHPITTDEYPLPAKRPKNALLDTQKLTTALSLILPHWKLYVDRTIDQLCQIEQA